MANIPDYLKDYIDRGLTDASKVGVTLLPPHVSLMGGRFTLIDAAGEKKMLASPYLDCCVFDVSPVICQRYYPEGWSPGSNAPPTCWSSNGIGPASEAMEPQAATCDVCPNNVRGSATSIFS